ncbi:hypothetical protein J4399_06395 [Candidatus Woesearchaeota archaeon]|nr:hypothetical protein [Candidatus Woesearchaeota archaeon]
MKLLGLFVVGFIGLFAVVFFSSDLILYLISGNPSLPTLDIGSQGI